MSTPGVRSPRPNKDQLKSKHYYQGGYDYEFVEELDPKFECPICLLCQRDPYQTSCGHRFCYSCILTWLNEGRTCPKDNCSLGEGDIFPDSMAHREIFQLFVRCFNQKSGCNQVMRLADAENHILQCSFSASLSSPELSKDKIKKKGVTESLTCGSCGEMVEDESTTGTGGNQSLICPNMGIACPYTSAGCTDRIPRKDLPHHVQTQTQKHMQLLCEKLMKLHQLQSLNLDESDQAKLERQDSGPDSLPETSLCRQESIRLSGSNIQSTQKLLKDLFHRVVQLEQKNCQLQIANQSLSQKLSDLKLTLETKSQRDLGRFCNGNFVWKIPNFSDVHRQMRHSRNFVVYSDGFYTSPFGYNLCLRCNINIIDGEEHLGLFVHLMKGENDEFLKWPFDGKIQLSLLHMAQDRLHREDFSEKMTSLQQKSAIQRPQADRNIIGYGFQEFIRANGLYTGGFVSADDCLVIRAVATEF